MYFALFSVIPLLILCKYTRHRWIWTVFCPNRTEHTTPPASFPTTTLTMATMASHTHSTKNVAYENHIIFKEICWICENKAVNLFIYSQLVWWAAPFFYIHQNLTRLLARSFVRAVKCERWWHRMGESRAESAASYCPVCRAQYFNLLYLSVNVYGLGIYFYYNRIAWKINNFFFISSCVHSAYVWMFRLSKLWIRFCKRHCSQRFPSFVIHECGSHTEFTCKWDLWTLK